MKRLFLGVIALVSSGCALRVTDFTVISTKNTMVSEGFERGSRVTGTNCVVVCLFPLGQPNLKEAIDDAIEKAGPGYDALVDGVVYYKNKSFFFGQVCYEVTGTPINSRAKKTTELAPEEPWRHSSLAARP